MALVPVPLGSNSEMAESPGAVVRYLTYTQKIYCRFAVPRYNFAMTCNLLSSELRVNADRILARELTDLGCLHLQSCFVALICM